MNANAIKIRKEEARKQEKDNLFHKIHDKQIFEQEYSMKKHKKSLKKQTRL